MFQNLKRRSAVAAVAVVSSLTAGTAAAGTGGGIDVSAIEAYISGDITTAITAVGGAIIILAVVAMGFKWIKGMIFG